MRNFSLLLRDGSCDSLVKKVVAFCLCPRSLPESKVKRLRLIVLRIEISKWPSIDSFMWFTIIKSVLMKHSNLKKKKKNPTRIQKLKEHQEVKWSQILCSRRL